MAVWVCVCVEKFNVIVWVAVLSALSERAMPNIYLPFTVTSWATLYAIVEGVSERGAVG